MWKRVPIVRLAGAAVAMLLAVSLAPARADGPSCSLSDLGQAAQDTYNDFLGQCATQFADPYYYPVLGAIGVAATTQQGKDFCHAIIDLDNQIKSAQSQYASAKGDLQTLLKYLPQSVQDEIQNSQLYNDLSGILTSANSIASSLSEAVGILVCACKAVTSSGLGELGSAVGSCADAAFCWLGLSSGCDCGNPPANVYVDCADISFPKPGDPDYFGSTVPRNALPDYGSDIQQFGDYLCYGCESYYGCVSHTFCYCPKPMVFKPGNMEWAGWDHYWECDCPDGSYKAGSGALARVCLCYSTNAPINADGSCPPPPPKCEPAVCPVAGQIAHMTDPGKTCDFTCGCPEGQTPAGGKCVAPCADPTKILLADGTCCAPSQAAACGTCCPLGMRPDDKTGLCASIPIPTQQPQAPTQNPNLRPGLPRRGP